MELRLPTKLLLCIRLTVCVVLPDSKLLRGMKRLDQLSEKIERSYPHLISAHVTVVRGQDWLQQVGVS